MVGESGKGQQGSNINQTRLDKKSRNTSGREWPERENQEGTRRRWKGSKGSRKTKKSRNKVTQGWGVVDRGRNSNEGGTSIYTGRRAERRSSMPASWYSSRRAWEKIENNGVGHQELLVARDNKWKRKIIIAVGWVSDLLEHEVLVWSMQNLFIDVPIRTQSLTTSAWYMK